MDDQIQPMVRYTSILLPLAQSRKRRLEEAAEARGDTLESFILEAAEAEAQRLAQWLREKGHSVDHQIYASAGGSVGAARAPSWMVERQIDVGRVAAELGWYEGSSSEWREDVDRLIDTLESLDGESRAVAPNPSTNDARRSPRRAVDAVDVLNPVRGAVLDISDSGLGVETRGPFSVPEEVQLSIGPGVAYAKIRAQVRWCVLVRTERFDGGDVVPIYRSGLAFVGH